jgi:hypothetical protein
LAQNKQKEKKKGKKMEEGGGGGQWMNGCQNKGTKEGGKKKRQSANKEMRRWEICMGE